MAEKDIGALLVMEIERLRGIVSECESVHSIAESERCFIEAAVNKYMAKVVITVSPDQTNEDRMKLMTDHHIHHLPVAEKEKVIGLVSIGDVVKADIQDKVTKINTLETISKDEDLANSGLVPNELKINLSPCIINRK